MSLLEELLPFALWAGSYIALKAVFTTQAFFSTSKFFLSNIHTPMNTSGSSSWHADLEQPGIEPPTFQLVDVLLDLLNHSHSKLTAPGIPRRSIRVLTGPDPCSVSEIRRAQGGRIVILLEQGPGFKSNSFSVWSCCGVDVPLRA